MNKKTIISIVLLLGVLATYFLLKRDTSSTLSSEETNFAVSENTNIDKIFMRSRYQNTSALLTKTKDGIWRINDKYDADGAKVDILLTAIRQLSVKFPVSENAWDMVIKNLSTTGTKVEVHSGNNIIKTYYVGGPTPDHQGTYVWMDGAKRPYVVHIEGFSGYLTPRFFVNERDWRSKMIYTYQSEDIEYVKVDWVEDPQQSFVIRNQKNSPILESEAIKSANSLNENKIRSFLNYFERLAYEGFPIDLNAKDIDSIYNKTQPFFVLTVKAKGKDEQTLKFHRKGLKRDSYQQLDIEGVKMPYEIDAYYAFLNNNTGELLQVQDFVFGKVMKKAEDFKLD